MIKINTVEYTPTFIKEFKSIPVKVQKILVEKEKLFRSVPIHPDLNTHRFDGQLDDIFTFSVTDHYKVAFIIGEINDATFISLLTTN
ncbi:MAG: hypothetical protein ABI425_05430 [Patescibacteria group bacterium]